MNWQPVDSLFMCKHYLSTNKVRCSAMMVWVKDRLRMWTFSERVSWLANIHVWISVLWGSLLGCHISSEYRYAIAGSGPSHSNVKIRLKAIDLLTAWNPAESIRCGAFFSAAIILHPEAKTLCLDSHRRLNTDSEYWPMSRIIQYDSWLKSIRAEIRTTC